MSSTLNELAVRRAQLVARSDQQRVEIARFYRQIAMPVKATGAALGLASSLRRSPVFIVLLAAILMKSPLRKLAVVPKLAWRGWKIMRFVRSVGR